MVPTGCGVAPGLLVEEGKGVRARGTLSTMVVWEEVEVGSSGRACLSDQASS